MFDVWIMWNASGVPRTEGRKKKKFPAHQTTSTTALPHHARIPPINHSIPLFFFLFAHCIMSKLGSRVEEVDSDPEEVVPTLLPSDFAKQSLLSPENIPHLAAAPSPDIRREIPKNFKCL